MTQPRDTHSPQSTLVTLSEREFDDAYPLLGNPFNPFAGWGIARTCGCLFDTTGEEFAFIRACDPRYVWTLTDGEQGDLQMISGVHVVNRIGYLLSDRPVPDGQTILVTIPLADVQ
jgi:hypothetical protein